MYSDSYSYSDYGFDEWANNNEQSITHNHVSQTDLFYGLLTLLHRGGTGYIWQCSEKRKRNQKPLKSGEWVWGDAAYKNTVWAADGYLVGLPTSERLNDMWLNVYFGVHPTNRAGESWQRSAKNPAAKSPHVVAINCVFAEFDAKDFAPELKQIADDYKAHLRIGGAIEDFDATGSRAALDRGMALALACVEQVPLQPTALINSGGGYHAYWILHEPLFLTDDATRKKADKLQKDFVKAVGSDDGAKDLARVLRVPGSHNHKGCYEDGPLPVDFVYFDQERCYSPEQIESLCNDLKPGPKMAWEAAPSKPTRPQSPTPKPIAKPAKTATSTKIEDIAFAQRCLTRLPKDKVESYASWIEVGLALYHSLGADGLPLWDEWSKQDSSWVAGECERKWSTFATSADKKLGLGTLALWAGVKSTKQANQDQADQSCFEEIKAKIEATEDKEQLLNLLLEKLRECAALDTQQRETIYILLQKKLTYVDLRRWQSNIRQTRKEMEQEKEKEKRRQAKEREREIMQQSAEAGRPMINVSAPDLNELTEQSIQHLISSKTLYVYGNALARIIGDQLDANINEKSLTYVLSHSLKFMERGRHGLESTMPPVRLAGNILARGHWPEFPKLKAMSRIPFVSQDGRLVVEDGYDEGSGVYLKSNIEIGDITPTDEMITWSKKHLKWILADYPFKTESDRTNAISFMLLPFVKPFIRGICPMCLTDAPTRGTGKTHLMKMLYTAVSGDDLAVTNFNSLNGDEEIEKKIVGFLLNGASHILLDNLTGELSSSVLEAMLTSRSYAPRLLGGNKVPVLPNNLIMLSTGNNVSLSSDMLSRTVFVRLDANMQDPTKRKFRNKYALEVAQTKGRAETVQACLILINKWLQDGMPQADIIHRFPRWADVMGGIMGSVGIDGFLDNKNDMEAMKDPMTAAWTSFFEAWWAGFRDKPVTVNDVFLLASFQEATDREPETGENLLGGLSKNEGGLTSPKLRGRKTQLGKVLSKSIEKVFGSFKLINAGRDQHKKAPSYKLEQV